MIFFSYHSPIYLIISVCSFPALSQRVLSLFPCCLISSCTTGQEITRKRSATYPSSELLSSSERKRASPLIIVYTVLILLYSVSASSSVSIGSKESFIFHLYNLCLQDL